MQVNRVCYTVVSDIQNPAVYLSGARVSIFSSLVPRLVVVDSLFYVSHIVCGGSVLVFVLLCITLYPYEFCNHLDEEERAGCFALFVFLMSNDY